MLTAALRQDREHRRASGSYANRAGLDRRLFESQPEMKEMALSKDAKVSLRGEILSSLLSLTESQRGEGI